ncbi:ATP-dependent DNA helicase RecG [Lactobacillus hominis]|uniref:ATP-dependent DNA helicase RecG n=1 Tax=Lactobacillus hominis DSM 23910 = CRBIP 24.179 TaxID=1423758 RepID=I7L6E7_9LACO|nr:ATP-dependent DNA helicase RecG [Lactobacillus hominis]KRM85541.1 atp-dependent dna helicase recg [Lactobacillus hominis DSM 23910 = CRBIP 24.179]MCT3347398.1 ATP-dependent DNA helicase RecG [Lactobacillus hominis]CCI81942.1 DNA helicase RecG [Lactobacillus hominis DSM 23910 = CRBIP 24.179]
MNTQTENKDLFAPVTALKGVGTKTAEALSSLGINSIYDLLFYFPFRYDELETLPLDQIMDGQKVLLKGTVVTEPFVSRFGYKKSRLSFKIQIDHDIVMVNFFNQPWLKDKLELGKDVAVYGKYNVARQSLSAFKFIAEKKSDSGLAAIYPLNRHVRQKKLQELIDQAIKEYLPQVDNVVPEDIRKKYRLETDQAIVQDMHHPKNAAMAKVAKRSAIFREFFLFQIQLAQMMSMRDDDAPGEAKKYDLAAIKELIAKLPFELSDDQKKVVNEIFADLRSPRQMRRLLQGDVGAGKTVVAVFAIYAVITAGYQAALMVPTEILAEQHFAKIDELLRPLGVRVALLTGDTKDLEKKEIYQELADGMINVVIGTHALIQDSVQFKNLGLAIIDEQHRFGVNQRNKLISKGKNPDILAMTATPIPRTLALTVYGEMAVSSIRHLPKGRKPIISSWVTSNKLRDVLVQMQSQLDQGFQIYVVTPLIRESEKSDLKNAEDLHAKLARFFKKENVVLLHGQMSGQEKNDIMDAFANKKIDILVTTSVIEVGVDVANANMMVIFNAERFGLSQLHQLRGRIGRGKTQSYCVFVSDPPNEVGKQRMEIITNTSDGFKLAEEDLKLRGEGDVFGKAQSGLPQFKVGDVVNDYNTLVTAQKEARNLIKQNKDLTGTQYQFLKDVLKYNKELQND